jgi:hypothetical protein
MTQGLCHGNTITWKPARWNVAASGRPTYPHSNDSGHGRLSFNALQQRRKVSGAFIRRLLTGWVEHEPSQFSLV